jgi:hypothetical protein
VIVDFEGDIDRFSISRVGEAGFRCWRKMKASYSLLDRLRNSRKITRRTTPMQEKANWV